MDYVEAKGGFFNSLNKDTPIKKLKWRARRLPPPLLPIDISRGVVTLMNTKFNIIIYGKKYVCSFLVLKLIYNLIYSNMFI